MSTGAFGEVRSLVQEAPSPQVWARLCGLLDEGVDDGTLRYVSDHIERWPDALRVLPQEWLARAARGEADARIALARGAECVGSSPRELEVALRQPGLAGLTWLSVEEGRPEDAVTVASGAPVGLVRLRMSGCRIGDAGAKALAGSIRLRGVMVLELARNRIGLDGARALGSWPGGALEELDLSGNPLGARSARALAAGPGLGKLKRLDLDTGRLTMGALEALAISPTLGAGASARWAQEWRMAAQ